MKKSMVVKTLAVASVSVTGLLSSGAVLAQENKTEQIAILSVSDAQKELDLAKEKAEKERGVLAGLNADLKEKENAVLAGFTDVKDEANDFISNKDTYIEVYTERERTCSQAIAQYELQIDGLIQQKNNTEESLKDFRKKAADLEKNKEALKAAEKRLADAKEAEKKADEEYNDAVSKADAKNQEYEDFSEVYVRAFYNLQSAQMNYDMYAESYENHPTPENKKYLDDAKKRLDTAKAECDPIEKKMYALQEERDNLNALKAAKLKAYEAAAAEMSDADNQCEELKLVVAESEEAKGKIPELEKNFAYFSEILREVQKALESLKTHRDSIQRQLYLLNNLDAYVEEISRVEALWIGILNGNSQAADTEYPELQPVVDGMNSYINIRNEIAVSKANLEKLEKEVQEKESLLEKAKEAEKKDETNKKDVSTALGLDAGLYASLAAISAAGFTVSMVKSKRKR